MTKGSAPVVLLALALSAAGCSDEASNPFGFLDSDTGVADAGADLSESDAAGELDATSDPPDDAPGDDASTADASSDGGPDDIEAAPDVDPIDPEWARVRVGTFNVARLFDDVCDSGRCDDNDFEFVYSEPALDYRVFQIGEGIRAMDVEIVLLQEVENQRALNRLLEELGDAWIGSHLGEIGGSATLDVAIVATHRIQSVETYRDEIAVVRPDNSITTFSREFLQATLNVEGRTVIVFTSHFKSKNNDDPGRRLGEAQSAREIVVRAARENPSALVVFGGDINDTPGSAPLAALEDAGSLVRAIPEGNAGTIVFRGESQAIDHLYLANDAAGVVVPGETRVVRDASGALGGSDHAAVRAEFALP